MNPRTFEIQVENKARRLRAWGDPSRGPAWVLLHDGLGSLDTWRDFPADLARASGFPVLAYERPGYGGSEGPPRPLPEALERETETGLPATLEACGVERPLLLGHSDGGTLALLAAARWTRAFRAVLVEAAHVFIEPLTVAGLEDARSEFEAGGLAQALVRHHGEGTRTVFGAWCDGWLSPGGRSWHMLDRLESITVPVVFVQGDADPYGTEAQVKAVTDRLPGRAAGLLLPGCGHAPHRERPAGVLEAARKLARQVDPG